MKALAYRFVSSIITERLDESFLCGVIFRPTYTASTSASADKTVALSILGFNELPLPGRETVLAFSIIVPRY